MKTEWVNGELLIDGIPARAIGAMVTRHSSRSAWCRQCGCEQDLRFIIPPIVIEGRKRVGICLLCAHRSYRRLNEPDAIVRVSEPYEWSDRDAKGKQL